MMKLFAAVTFVASVSALVAIPAKDVTSASRVVLKADRVETRTSSQVRNYLSPSRDGRPVAFCISGESGCGKEAADAFCRGSGFIEAITFQRDHGASDLANVYFHQIKCRRSPAPVHDLGDVIIEPAGAPLITNWATKSDSL